MSTQTQESQERTISLKSALGHLCLWTYYLLVALCGVLLFANLFESDTNFILYRFSANILNGQGIDFLVPRQHITTYPVTPCLVALVKTILNTSDMSLATVLVTGLAMCISAVCLARLAGNRWIAGGAYLLVMAIHPSPPLAVMLAFGLAALDAIQHERSGLAGLLLGLAILTEPSALLLAFLVLLFVVRLGNSLRRFVIGLVPLPVAYFGLTAAFAPGTFISPITGNTSLFVLLFLAMFALARTNEAPLKTSSTAVLLGWGTLVAAINMANGNPPTAAIFPGLILTAVEAVPGPVLLLAILFDMMLRLGFSAPFTFLNIDDPSPGMETGQWIGANLGKAASVAIVGTNDIGALSYYAGGPIIDLSGKIQANTLDSSFIFRHAPDVVVLHEAADIPWNGFKTTYANTFTVSPLRVYQRVVNFAGLENHGVDVNFSASLGRRDLRLTNIGIANRLHPGEMVRVRLDWELVYIPRYELEVKLDLLNAEGIPLTGSGFERFKISHAGTLSTYHGFLLPDSVNNTRGRLLINVGMQAGSFGPPVQIAEVEIAR